MSLELVKDQPPTDFNPADLSPELAGSMVYLQVRPEDGAHLIDFDTEFDGPSLAGVLALDQMVIFGSEADTFSDRRLHNAVKSGLRTLTYPNSRVMRNAKYVDRDARQQLVGARPDIKSLVTAIDHPEHHRMVPAKLTLYSELMAGFAVDTELQDLKPSELKKLCELYDVNLDELALARLKGRRRDSYIDASDFIDDADKLKTQYKLDRFKRAYILPDEDESVLTEAGDWPKDGWSEKADAIQRVHELPSKQTDSLGIRWQVLIRDDSSARHVVRPRLVIRSDAKKRIEEIAKSLPHVAHGWNRPETYLLFEPQPPTYDRTRHTVIHHSAVLGAALLMRHVEPDLVNNALRSAIFGKEFRPWRQVSIPDKVVGLAPLVAQNIDVQHQILASPGVRALVPHFGHPLG